jgi:hypothetical protein
MRHEAGHSFEISLQALPEVAVTVGEFLQEGFQYRTGFVLVQAQHSLDNFSDAVFTGRQIRPGDDAADVCLYHDRLAPRKWSMGDRSDLRLHRIHGVQALCAWYGLHAKPFRTVVEFPLD